MAGNIPKALRITTFHTLADENIVDPFQTDHLWNLVMIFQPEPTVSSQLDKLGGGKLQEWDMSAIGRRDDYMKDGMNAGDLAIEMSQS